MANQERIYMILTEEHKMISGQEIVRCKDCSLRHTPDCRMFLRLTDENLQWEWTENNGFCHWGRKNE